MSAKDISRFLFQPQKRYSGVRMQQGRVILDSDWNESERIDDEEARRTLLDIVCSKGTSNDGFRVGDVRPETVEVPQGGDVEFPFTPVSTYDFPLGDGSFYLGGLRFESDADGMSFLDQDDWLQFDADPAFLPGRPEAADLTDANGNPRERHDLVYLFGWEQCVTAVEDSELRERALGGPDTSVRVRRMRRVAVLTDSERDCEASFAELVRRLTLRGRDDDTRLAELDPASCELRSLARLTVGFDDEGVTEDPCKPRVEAGFLGAENQTIRVELTAPDRFVWGIDNASPWYRVQVLEEEGEPARIKFLTLPRDQASQPLQGQAVEIHPWGALLPNQEKVAELRGHLSTVATSFDPETGELTLTDAVPQAWLDWLDHPDHADYLSDRDPDGQQKYFYLRLWTGGSGLADEPDFAFAPGAPVELTGTGLTVSFNRPGIPGDHWIIAARPRTPDTVVGWELMSGAPPAGTRYFLAPLAVIHWSVGGIDVDTGETGVVATVDDCRQRFRPLCESCDCPTVTVGDGRRHGGDFDSIEAALAHLGARGGVIQLLPGIHRTDVLIEERRNIRIRGCGKDTIVLPRPANGEDAIFRIVDSRCITLEHMVMVSFGGSAVALAGRGEGTVREIDIGHNRIVSCRDAIRAGNAAEVHIHHNRIRIMDKEGGGLGIVAQLDDSLIERNEVGVVPARRVPPPEVPGDDDPDPNDPCEDPERIYGNTLVLVAFVRLLIRALVPGILLRLVDPYRALGGIQILAGSERVRVLENRVNGGAGNGITLGGSPPAAPVEVPDEREEFAIESEGRAISGFAQANGKGVNGVNLVFTSGEGTTISAVSGSDGGFQVIAPADRYAVTVTTPGWRIDSITVDDLGEFGRRHRINLARVEVEVDLTLAFLYEISIEGNEVLRMGLSAIGIPRVTVPVRVVGTTTSFARATDTRQSILARLGNPLIGLDIHRNHLHNCVLNPFDELLRAEVRRRGIGGISLGFCENLSITANRIERNGLTASNPVCGIFVTYAERAAIDGNQIADNGPLTGADQDPLPGNRGGIVMLAGSFGLDDVLLDRKNSLDTGRNASRIHDNVIDQPAGHALRLLVIGPASICQNRFHTERSGPEALDRLAGSVLILNAGGSGRLPAGLTLFNDNQTRLGPGSDSIAAKIIWTLDDLGYDGNQTNALADGIRIGDVGLFFINTFLVGATLRALGSRFKESPHRGERDFRFSLLTRTTQLNNTNFNHGDHCIFAVNTAPGRPANQIGNQVINDALCKALLGALKRPTADFAATNAVAGRLSSSP